jgi:FkbM family methyltransferase
MVSFKVILVYQDGNEEMKEYIAHYLIGTPLEGSARKLRELAKLPKRIQHPELQEIYIESDRFEAAMARIITDSMNCIDVGAHLGSVLSVMKQLSPTGKHIAIEPIPYKYKWLKQKFPDVEVHQLALSDTSGEVDFFLQPHRSGFSGLRLHNSGDTAKDVEILKVDCRRLDDIVPADRPIGFMKIDVEGGELAVLRGGESILKRDKPTLVFECTQSGLTAHNLSPKDMYDFFEAYSYSIFLIKDWLADGAALNYEQLAKAMQYPFQAFNFLATPNEKP